MHELENIKLLYRARHFYYKPNFDRALKQIFDAFGGRSNVPFDLKVEFFEGIEKHGFPDDPWKVFYEPCPVIKIKPMTIAVESQNMPPEIQEAFPDFYAGGIFHIQKAALQRDGKAYHSRHGEYFHLFAPETAIALPETKKLLEADLCLTR
jgi:hypothetical protein